jgi:hypothetical protein
MQKLKIRAVWGDLLAEIVPILALKCGLIRQVDRKHRIACIVNWDLNWDFEKNGLPNNGYVYWAFRAIEKNRSGPQRHKFPPACPKFEPLPKRFFSPHSSKSLICLVHLRINRMNQKIKYNV